MRGLLFILSILILESCSPFNLSNVQNYYDDRYFKSKAGCYDRNYKMVEKFEQDTFVEVFLPTYFVESELEKSGESNYELTYSKNPLIHWYTIREVNDSNQIKKINDPKNPKDFEVYKFEDFDVEDYRIVTRKLESEDESNSEGEKNNDDGWSSIKVIHQNIYGIEDVTPVALELRKGDYFSIIDRREIICPEKITSSMKYDLCKELEEENFEKCYNSSYHEYLKELVIRYQKNEFGYDKDFLYSQTLDNLNIKY